MSSRREVEGSSLSLHFAPLFSPLVATVDSSLPFQKASGELSSKHIRWTWTEDTCISKHASFLQQIKLMFPIDDISFHTQPVWLFMLLPARRNPATQPNDLVFHFPSSSFEKTFLGRYVAPCWKPEGQRRRPNRRRQGSKPRWSSFLFIID